ncbi:EAL domain-containing protein [Zavarzinia sp. CC-PAN008]|uniref:EAL domain-containing protein n=1 Tax=Zavarzinia sp. CC-PAN008 TaxID=3243332 RepID=UPI003F744DA2
MDKLGCGACRDGEALGFDFSMAFQPVVDVEARSVISYEALVRGPAGEGAFTVLSRVDEANRYTFDQQCRVRAISLAAGLGLPEGAALAINFLPNAVYEPRACIRLSLAAARSVGLPLDRMVFEFTENEQMDSNHLLNIIRTYQDIGFRTAIDDFGAGHSGLNLLARIRPDIVKIDMELVRGVDTDRRRRAILGHTLAMLADLDIKAVCEGVETRDELSALRDLGCRNVQGYLLARPAFQALPPVDWSVLELESRVA